MSKFLPPGHHPDADQLSAFAEQVLPDHERLETLAHLAECADCRQVVFLAQRAQEAKASLAHAPLGKRGWLSWRDLWPVAAALACGLLVVAAFLQRRHPTDLRQKSDVAFESAAPAPPSQAQLPGSVVPGVPPSAKPSTAANVSSSPHIASASPHSGVGGIAPVRGDLATDHLANNLSVFSPNAPATGRQTAYASSGRSSSPGGVVGPPVAQAPPLLEKKKNDPLNVDEEQMATLQSQNRLFPQQATARRPLSGPSQSDIQRSASQTISITGAAPALQTESAVVSGSVSSLAATAQAKGVRAPLPSKRPAVSAISNGRETLAVDSAGDLFICEDAGIGWRRIAHQWTGKAIKVSVASPASMTQPASGKTLSAGATTSKKFETATTAADAPRADFELTTDIGTIWSSPDGLVWKQR
jgi:hypothetical protein